MERAEETPKAPLRRALIVDDDAAIRILVSRILQRHRFSVDAVPDGAEAIEKLLQHTYDVIVLDLMMPRIDGEGVIKYLVEHQPQSLPNVIVVTAFGSRALQKVCPPVVRFLEKPFDIERLLTEAEGCAGGQPPDVPADALP
ncbi:MAG TPA: response regulator [Thermoanaerobaculia bacterium]|nr:response regulator [Thermoanaerobaculia bacterium]